MIRVDQSADRGLIRVTLLRDQGRSLVSDQGLIRGVYSPLKPVHSLDFIALESTALQSPTDSH